jgi:hypothetical protein
VRAVLPLVAAGTLANTGFAELVASPHLLRPAAVSRPGSEAASLIEGLERAASSLAPEALPAAIGQLEELKVRLWVRYLSFSNGHAAPAPDIGLDVGEASRQSGLSIDALYRRPWPFKRQEKRGGKVTFSRVGIEEWLRNEAYETDTRRTHRRKPHEIRARHETASFKS